MLGLLFLGWSMHFKSSLYSSVPEIKKKHHSSSLGNDFTTIGGLELNIDHEINWIYKTNTIY